MPLAKIQKLTDVYFYYLLILFFAYFPLLLFPFGYSDDYESLFWSFTQGTLPIKHEISSGRPFFGFFRYLMVNSLSSMQSLSYFRGISFFLVSFYALFIYYFLVKREIISNKYLLFFFPILMAILPAVQSYVSWVAFCWLLFFQEHLIAYLLLPKINWFVMD